MRDYGQYCPVALGSEIVADRWTPLIIRELVLGATRFSDIARGLPGISRTLLGQRLKTLERKGIVVREPSEPGGRHEYHLTPAGRDLEGVLMALGEWSVRWLYTDPEPAAVDPITLSWWMHHRIDGDALPDHRVVVEVRYQGEAPTTVWFVLERGDTSVCVQHPGFEPDVVITTEPVSMMEVFAGITTLAAARRAGTVEVVGAPHHTRRLAAWFQPSPFAPAVRRRLASGPEPVLPEPVLPA